MRLPGEKGDEACKERQFEALDIGLLPLYPLVLQLRHMMNDRERMFYDFRGVPDEEDEKPRRALREPLLQSVAHAVNTWGIYQAERLSAFFL